MKGPVLACMAFLLVILYLPTGVKACVNPRLLYELKRSAAAVYPGDIKMQKVAVTQAIHESNLTGKGSTLANEYNNLFGIKGTGSAGSVSMKTWEHYNGQNIKTKAKFASYLTKKDCFHAYKRILSNKRYLGVHRADNVYDAFQALHKGGYATDPKYPEKLYNVYTRYVKDAY